MDKRHFIYYDDPQRRLRGQVDLLQKLEQNGFETKGKHILTTETIGIPVTSMLLLTKESLEFLIQEQEILLENETNKIKATLSMDQFYEETSFSPTVAGLNCSWYKKTVWDVDPTPTVSGSVVAYQSHIYLPTTPVSDLKLIFNAPNDKWTVYSGLVHAKMPHIEEKNLIQIYKNILLFSEFTYAIQERVMYERDALENHQNKRTTKRAPSGSFASVSMMRGAIIHDGSFKLTIDPETSKIIVSAEKKDILTKFTTSFEEMISWIDETYKEMLTLI